MVCNSATIQQQRTPPLSAPGCCSSSQRLLGLLHHGIWGSCQMRLVEGSPQKPLHTSTLLAVCCKTIYMAYFQWSTVFFHTPLKVRQSCAVCPKVSFLLATVRIAHGQSLPDLNHAHIRVRFSVPSHCRL